MLCLLVEYIGFDIDKFFGKFNKKVCQVVFYGIGIDLVLFYYLNDCGDVIICNYLFEGIIFNMEWRYCEIELDVVREELFKFLSVVDCRICNGFWFN